MVAIGFEFILFLVLALVAILSSLLMVTRKNPIHSALWMIVAFLAMAVIYLLLNAHFIAIAQVMVYAGAIMMLILFVIMMVNMDRGAEEETKAKRWSQGKKTAGAVLITLLLLELLFGALFYRMTARMGDYPPDAVAAAGNTKTLGALLYGQYLFPFEIASILLLIGIVGAVVIGKRSR